MKEYNHLHVFHDEKFTNSVTELFLASEEPNQFFVLIKKKNSELIYPLNTELPITIIQSGSEEYLDLIANLNKYNSIFIHYLCDLKFDFIDSASATTKIIWMCWGQDIHKLIIPRSYLPRTKLLLLNKHKFSEFFWEYTLPFRLLKFPYTRKGRLLKRIDYCCPVIEEDLIMTNKKLGLDIKYIPFHYGTMENNIGDEFNSSCKGHNVLVGNSSSYASNHLDVFKELEKFNLKNRKIIVPLNYGDKLNATSISEIGNCIFGDGFVPIVDFLPRKDYNKLVLSCSVAIFNHLRQQALGNIFKCLWLGIRVYMNNKSPLYDALIKLGLRIYSIQEDLNVGNKLALEKMEDDDVTKNKIIMLKEFGRTNTVGLIKKVFDTIE